MIPKYKVYIFDLDDTIYNYSSDSLYDDVLIVLETLKLNNIPIYLASHNYNSDEILRRFNIINYFKHIYAYYDVNGKISHIKQILNLHPKVGLKDVCLFDDLYDNLEYLKISTCLIDYKKGIRIEDI